MAKQVRKTPTRTNTTTKVGARSASGHQSLTFKKGTKNYSETQVKKTNPNKPSGATGQRKTFTGVKQRPNEGAGAYLKRRSATKKK